MWPIESMFSFNPYKRDEIIEENEHAARVTPEEIRVLFEGDRRERPRNGEVWTELERNVKTGRG